MIRDLGGNPVNYPTDADHNGHIRITSSDPLASIGVAALDGFTDFVGGYQAVSYSNVRMRTPGLQTVTVTDPTPTPSRAPSACWSVRPVSISRV